MKRGFFITSLLVILIAITAGGWLYVSSSSPANESDWKGKTPVPTKRSALGSNDEVVPSLRQEARFDDINLPFYGIDFVPTEDLPVVASLGAEVVSQVFPHDEDPRSWLHKLDQAQKHSIKVIAWLFPQGWEWDGRTWIIDDQASSFIQTVANHPALFAVYALHEPYWQDCWGCGYTTYQQQLLYNQIKEIGDVKVFSAIGSMAFWTKQGQETAFTDGICDYCATWYYPFTVDGYERDELIAQLQDDLSVARERAPRSKIVWSLQAFSQDSSGFRLPTADELYDLASLVYEYGVDGAMWYVWTFNSLYDDFLSNQPELYDTVRQVYQDQVLPRR